MTSRIYRTFVRLYPREFKAAFAAEMIETNEQKIKSLGERSALAKARFFLSETIGVLAGAFSEWLAKWTDQDAYISPRCHAPEAEELPEDLADLQAHIRQLVRSMEFAIAHHDFPKARFYSNQERIARATLMKAATPADAPAAASNIFVPF